MPKQLYRYMTTFPLFPSHFRAVLHMLQQLYRNLATFPLFPINLKLNKKAVTKM